MPCVYQGWKMANSKHLGQIGQKCVSSCSELMNKTKCLPTLRETSIQTIIHAKVFLRLSFSSHLSLGLCLNSRTKNMLRLCLDIISVGSMRICTNKEM